MASVINTTIRYADLQLNYDETSLESILFDIKGLETDETRANDFINSTFFVLQSLSLKVDFDLSNFDDDTGAKKATIKQAFIYLALGTIFNSTNKKLGNGFKSKGMNLLENVWGSGIYSQSEGSGGHENFFKVTEVAYIATDRQEDLYDNDLFG